MKISLCFLVVFSIASIVSSAEYHVSPTGNDANPGTPAAPLRTIQRAAELAQPGDTITVHEGVYRERVNPPRGGESDAKRIVYQAAPGETVEIKGSEVVKNWENVEGDVWRVVLPNAFFGKFNPRKAEEGQREVPAGMLTPQVVMAAASVLLGVLPWLAVEPIKKGVMAIVGGGVAGCGTVLGSTGIAGPLVVDLGTGPIAAWSPVVIFIAGAVCFLLSWSLFRAGAAPVREDATWYCGEVHSDEEVRYKARGLYLSFKQFFRIRIGAYEQPGVYPQIRYPRFELHERNLARRILNVDNWFFYPLTAGFMRLMRYFSGTHVGIPHVYLLWLVIGVLLAIFILFALAGGGA